MDNIKGGMGFGSIIFVVLFILKLTGNVDMSWFWVLSSFIWAPLVFIIPIFLFVGFIILISFLF